jgi:TRAP-type transport system periplasmic protein
MRGLSVRTGRSYLSAGALFVGVISLGSSAMGQSREFRLSIVSPPTYFWNQELVAANEALKRESSGRLSIVVLPGKPETPALQQLQNGTLDMAWVTSTGMETLRPEFGAIHAPFLVRNVEQAAKFFEAPGTLSLLNLLPEVGLVGLGFGMSGMRQIYVRDLINSPADLNGKKIRIVPTATSSRDFFTSVGMTPTPLPFREIYNALATGQIDAMELDLEGTADYMFHDFLKTLLLTNHSMLGCVAVVSTKVWSALSQEDQAVLRLVMQKHLANIRKSAVAQEGEYLARLRRSHLKIIEVESSAFDSAVSEWNNVWLPKAPILRLMREAVKEP